MLWLGLVVAAALLAAAVAGVRARRGEMAELAQRGVRATARVAGKRRMGTPKHARWVLRLEYRGPDGREHVRRLRVGRAVFGRVQAGDAIEIALLPGRPEVSAPLDAVNRAREPLGLPPL